MRIEIYKDVNGISTSDGFYNNINAFLEQSELMISSLNHIKKCSCLVNGGIGSLRSAVDSLELKISNEKCRKIALNDIQSKYNGFIECVNKADASAEEKVSQNTKEFYDMNQWASPSIHFDDFLGWRDKAKAWIKKDTYDTLYAISRLFAIAGEKDYTWMSRDELKENYDKFIIMLDSGELDDEDRARLLWFMNCLGKTKVAHDTGPFKSDKIAYYNDLYERLNPNKKINNIDNNYKYLIYRGGSKSFSVVAADVLKHGELAAGNISDIEKEDVYSHGNFKLYDFDSNRNDDGSVSVNFEMSTQWKTMAEITVYDADGNIYGERKYLAGQRDPSGIIDVFGEGTKYVGDFLNSRFFSHDAEANQSKDRFTLDIPPGGCIRITDDVSLMNNAPYSGIIVGDILNRSEIAIDVSDAIETGNVFMDTFADIIISSSFQVEHDVVDNKNIDFKSICENACKTVYDSVYSEVADAFIESGNPAGIVLKGVDYILKANTLLESKVAAISESNTFGNGAIIIYP